jgi:hypothetical protein
MHLTGAYRSLPRPSSPLSAKAFTIRPCFALKFFKDGITTTLPEVTPHVLKTHFKVTTKKVGLLFFLLLLLKYQDTHRRCAPYIIIVLLLLLKCAVLRQDFLKE